MDIQRNWKENLLCVFCTNPSTFLCERCNDGYCSEKCQRADWGNHRIICFPMPTLIPISGNDLMEKLSELKQRSISQFNTFAPKSEDSGNSSDECTETVKGEEYSGEVQVQIDNSTKTIENNLNQMDTLIYISSNEDNELSCSMEEIVEISSEDEKYLEDVKSRNEFCDDLSMSNDLIVNKSQNCFSLNDLKIHNWPKSKNVKVRKFHIVQKPNIIAFVEDKIQMEEFYRYIHNEIRSYARFIGQSYSQYLPKRNEIVLGLFEEKWQRAWVLDSDIKGIIVQFIDYGNMELLKPSQVLPADREKLSFEVCARIFIVDNIPENLTRKQREILSCETMMITNISEDDNGFFHCNIFGF